MARKLSSYTTRQSNKTLENIMNKIHLENSYDEWVRNFALNLENIWKEPSARDLVQTDKLKQRNSSIVVGAGPSISSHNHLQKLAKSGYSGNIICTDRSLIPVLKAGVTPEKFSNFFVVTIDPAEKLKKFYENKIVLKYGKKIKGIFTSVVHPSTVEAARKRKVKIHWIHALFDYNEGKKSFNQTSAAIVRAKKHTNGLPAIQTGGNVGTSCWFIGWKILRSNIITLIGIDHSWAENDPLHKIAAHCNVPLDIDKKNRLYQKLFPRIYNPEFKCFCILDPIFQYYSSALKEFILRSPKSLTTINATEGGCIFGDRITCMTLSEFLGNYKQQVRKK